MSPVGSACGSGFDIGLEHFAQSGNAIPAQKGILGMTTPLDTPDWRSMSQHDRDLGLNNSAAVAGSTEIVTGWEQRSAELRQRYPAHLDLRYGPRERNRIDFIKAGENAPTLLFIHGGYWQARSKEVFTI